SARCVTGVVVAGASGYWKQGCREHQQGEGSKPSNLHEERTIRGSHQPGQLSLQAQMSWRGASLGLARNVGAPVGHANAGWTRSVQRRLRGTTVTITSRRPSHGHARTRSSRRTKPPVGERLRDVAACGQSKRTIEMAGTGSRRSRPPSEASSMTKAYARTYAPWRCTSSP